VVTLIILTNVHHDASALFFGSSVGYQGQTYALACATARRARTFDLLAHRASANAANQSADSPRSCIWRRYSVVSRVSS